MKIYKLIDPTNNNVMYIGRTQGDLIDRLAEHIAESSTRTGSGTRFTVEKRKWIRCLLEIGRAPIIELIEHTDDKYAEFRHIIRSRFDGDTLLNTSGKNITQELLAELPYKNNHYLSQKHNVGVKTIALVRKAFNP